MECDATFICIDNSDYNRNEDVFPNRFMSQIDCVNVFCCNKTSSHYDNYIGILMMAGDKIKVKVALTNDIGQLLASIHSIELDGICDILRSLSIAQLALKHRVNKILKQKIILFIGSPINVNEKLLLQTGKQLKKNNISIDIVSYGKSSKDNKDKLMKLYECVNNNNNCKYIEVPENEVNLSTYVLNMLLNNNYAHLGNMQEDEQILNAVQMSMSNNTNEVPNLNINNTVSNQNDLPTIEEIQNMTGIDNELREALLLSLREYQERNEQTEKENEKENELSKNTLNEKGEIKDNNITKDVSIQDPNLIRNTNEVMKNNEENKDNINKDDKTDNSKENK